MNEPFELLCEPCQEKRGIDRPGTQEWNEAWPLCDSCRQDYAEKMDEAKFTDYWSGYTAEDGRSR